MPRTAPALITPAVLAWAREQARLEPGTAAKRAAVSADRLVTWEEGKAQPTIRQARLLAAAYRQPFAALFLPEPPPLKTHLPKDYRRLAATVADAVSSVIWLDVNDAWHRRDVVLELLKAQDVKPPALDFSASLTTDPEDLGTRLRAFLSLPLEEQREWRDQRRGFNAWRGRVEMAGVLVLQASEVPLAEMRAYSLHAPILPVIVLNRKDVPAARTFSLLHELVHLSLHKEGLCDLTTDVRRNAEDQYLEVFCNAAAAACLIPRSALLKHPLVHAHPRDPRWADRDIEELSRVFSTSREALLRRLLTFNLTTKDFYELKRKQYVAEYRSRPKVAGFLSPAQDALSSLGRPYVRLVLSGLESQKITTSDASDYLGIRLKHLPALVSALEAE